MFAGYAAGECGARLAVRDGAMVAVVVDAFRASTTIAVLVRKGARVAPVASIEEVVHPTLGPTTALGSAVARRCEASIS